MVGLRHREDPSKNFVGCVVGSIRYALPIARVREIVNPLTLVELPSAPHAVLGVADYRQDVVSVVSLRLRFGLPFLGDSRRTKWIVIETGSRLVALVVDAVTEVFRSAAVRPPPMLGGGDDVRGIEGVTENDGEMVFVLDLSRFESVAAATSVPILPAVPSETSHDPR